jgi:hypothetical protein
VKEQRVTVTFTGEEIEMLDCLVNRSDVGAECVPSLRSRLQMIRGKVRVAANEAFNKRVQEEK